MFFTPEQVVSCNKTFPILSIALKPGRRRSGYRNVVAVTEGRIRFDQITIQFTAMAILLFAVRPQKKTMMSPMQMREIRSTGGDAEKC